MMIPSQQDSPLFWRFILVHGRLPCVLLRAFVRPVGAFFGPCILVLWLVLPTYSLAQTFQRNLTEVKVYGAKSEKVEFFFSQPYRVKPEVRLENKTLKVRFSATGIEPSGQTLKPPPNALYQRIHLQQNRYGASAHFLLAPTTHLQPQNIRFEHANNRLVMHLDSALTLPNTTAGSTVATSTAQNANPASMPDLSLWRTVGVMLVVLVVMLTGLYGVLWLYRKLLSKGPLGGQKIDMRIAGSFALGPRQQVVVLEIDGKRIACGVTPQHISFLTHLHADDGTLDGSTGQVSKQSLPLPAEAVGKDPLRQFASALKHKVQNLRDMP